MRSICTIQNHVINFQPFWLHLLFFMHLKICFELNDPEIEKHYKWTLNRLKLVMVSSFHPHSICKKVERVTTKTGRTSCTNWTISFEVSGFGRKLICYKGRHFIFLNLLQLQTFLRSVCTIQSHVINFQPFQTSFAIFHAFTDLFWAKWPWNWKALQMNSEKVETCHGIIILPT